MNASSTSKARARNENMEGDDSYYMTKMKEILEAPPDCGLPKHPRKLLDYVFIGNQDNADDLDLISDLGITHVLNCAGTRNFDLTRSPYPPDLGIVGFRLLPAHDFEEFDMMQFFPEAITFLDRVKESGGKALVHCNLGVNRSGAIAAVYMMATQRKTLLEVIYDLKIKRSKVLCNVGFRRQVLKYARARGLLDPVVQPNGKHQMGHEIESRENKSSSWTERCITSLVSNGYKSTRLERSDSAPAGVMNGNTKLNHSLNSREKYCNGEESGSSSASRKEYNGSSSSYKFSSRSFDEDLISSSNRTTSSYKNANGLSSSRSEHCESSRNGQYTTRRLATRRYRGMAYDK